MTQLNTAGQRVIPYAGYKFRIKEVGGDYFFAVNKVGALSRTVEVMEYREGGDPSLTRKSPGQAKDLLLEIYNEAGQLALGYNIYRAWVSEYRAFPELDASASSFAIQTIKLEHEGWEREYSITMPAEPAFTEPE